MPKSRPSSTRTSDRRVAVQELRRRVFRLTCDLEEPLDQALAFTNALNLMGYGLNSIGDDHGPALLAVAEAMTGQLTTAKKTWRQIVAASRREPRATSHRMRRTSRRGSRKQRPDRDD